MIIGINIYSMNASKLAGNEVPMPFGVGAAVVLSGSMEPELSVGDLLIIAERDGYSVGDVVVYQDGRMSVTHRIVSATEEEIVTRGDANVSEDEPITPDAIKGEVVLAIPFVGYAVNVIKTPIVTLIILGLAIWLLERSFRLEKAKDNDELKKIREEIEKLKEQSNKDIT